MARLLEFTGGELPTRQGIREFLADQLERNSPATAVVRHRSIKSFFHWAAAEREIPDDPALGIAEPHIPEARPPVAEIRRLLEAARATASQSCAIWPLSEPS